MQSVELNKEKSSEEPNTKIETVATDNSILTTDAQNIFHGLEIQETHMEINEVKSQESENIFILEETVNSSTVDLDSNNETEINLGYDIISDYPSSVEEATSLISRNNELEKINFNTATLHISDQIQSVENSNPTIINELNSFENNDNDIPSAPCDSKMQNYFHDDQNIYKSKVRFPDVVPQNSFNVENNKEKEEKLIPFNEAEMSTLYYNQELHNQFIFVKNFIEIELKSGIMVQHPLHELLTEYLTCRDNLRKNELDFNNLIENYKQFQEKIWNLDKSSLTEYGECQDGNPVSATHHFNVAHFNKYIYEKFMRSAEDLEILTTEHYATNIFNVNLYRIKIEHFIDSLCYQFNFLSPYTPIHLHSENVPRGPLGADYRNVINSMKNAISVLFSFQRRPIKDETFIIETRKWLEKLLSILLRVSTASDHLFILHHIMRCPAGIGKWASHYIQLPVANNGSLYNQQHIDHLITVLAIILLPVESRELFLQQMNVNDDESKMWVVIDSDGEDSETKSVSRFALKENDLISFLNQIPFADIFRQIILVSHRGNEDIYDINVITDRDVLRSIVISTLLVNLLEKGISNYSCLMYKQFCKLLSRLIKHTASYISEHWEMFRETYTQRSIVDSAMLNRLQTEYDEFLMRVVRSLYTTHDRIGWQYLATLPFGMISTQTLWRLYQYLLHTNTDNNVLMSEEFMENLTKLPDNDIYYFLTTISNMALVRLKDDWLFIQSVTLQLFKIGFVNVTIREKCMKSTRILIANLTNKYPNLISDLLLTLKKDFIFVGKFSLYLFKELPIALWKPNQVDILTFSEWLLNYSLSSWENNLARYILSHLNWSFDLSETDLFLSRDFHCQIAIIIVKVLYVYFDDVIPMASTTIISQGMRQMSSMIRNLPAEQALNDWSWKILSQLKLHLLDQPVQTVRMTLTDFRMVAQIPDINNDTEHMRTLCEGLSKNQSVAYYISLLMSSLGHSLPLICESCWDHCEILLSDHKFVQVLHILQLVLPFFLDSVQSLLQIEKFRNVILKLLTADQTYMKMAKNLIMADFPSSILSQFASLIQYHIENFNKYCLPNANQMVELWLRVLCLVWNEDCFSVAYLIDKILSFTFNDEILRKLVINILSELINNMPADRSGVGGKLSSFVNFISYGNVADTVPIKACLLPRNSNTITYSSYFAFFALHLEEYFTQTETQLWPEVLKILSITSGKPNIDNAVKKACSNLKLVIVTSSWLAIYRWSQYALELPNDHPILPLFWQQFFRLYLYRIPGTSVCVSGKFFEGAVNYNYFRKIKKKLLNCVNYFENKTTDNELEKNFYNSLTLLYKAFLLWLEESRLQEPDVFIPALPSTFLPTKLSEIINGKENIWIEYINFDKIKSEQKALADKWMEILYRNRNRLTNRIICFPEDTDLVADIINRLRSYDLQLSLPPLIIVPTIVPDITSDCLLNKSLMLENLSEHFYILLQFTGSYEIEKSERTNTAVMLFDAFRQLYNEVETEIKLYAACDTSLSLYKRKTVSSINCAGPARIIIQVREGKLNNTAKHSVEKCDVDFQRLLRNNLKIPPTQIAVACIVIEHAADSLRNERTEVRKIGDIMILNSIQDVGVGLFYKLVSSYDSQISEYFPTKLFIRKIIDKLGQSFIDEIESECPKLLKTILTSPKLSSILISHFTPSIVSASAFVHLYRKVTTIIPSKNINLILDLITKFDVNDWLRKKAPRYADRSQLIEVIALALKEIGLKPSDALLSVHKILRRDLCEILVYDFPEHYGEILHVLLRFSAEEKFSCDVWYDILNSLLISASNNLNINTDTGILQPGLSIIQIRDIARKYASELRSLTFQELNETVNILNSNFLKERLQYGLYGLYPKYSVYMEPIIILQSIVGHATIASILHVHRGMLADKICEKIWPILLNLFAPWIVPYFTRNLHEPPAAWIQKLTDDRSILLPWTSGDVLIANKMMNAFMECLKFVLDALPASSVILSNICDWYITEYAHESVKEHVLNVVQSNLITLCWSRFTPSLNDLELMLKVVDQYLPVCHSFLGSVFIEIQWNIVMQNDLSLSSARAHIILLNLLIKLANEPNLRQVQCKSEKVISILISAQRLQWHLVDVVNYEYVLNWFVMSYDPHVIIQSIHDDWNGIDMACFNLLQVAGGYVTENTTCHTNASLKRKMFVKICVKMVLQWAHRYKNILTRNHTQMESALTRMLDKMESVMTLTVSLENQLSECTSLVSEILVLINQPTSSMLPKIMMQVILNWLSHRAAPSPILQSLLRIIGTEITDHLHLGIILEACLTAWFKNSAGMEECDWSKVMPMLQMNTVIHPSIEITFLENNFILSLYAITLKQIGNDNEVVYNKIIRWITSLKPNNDTESKLPLLWCLVFNNCTQNVSKIKPMLMKLCVYFQQITNVKSGWALLGVIGMNKQPIPSLRCKVLCYSINAFILMKLCEETNEVVEDKSSTALENESKEIMSTNTERIKSMSALENLFSEKQYAEFRVTIDLAVRLVKSKEITLKDGEKFIITLAKQLYTDGFIHAFKFEEL